jgi:hypothetical protein
MFDRFSFLRPFGTPFIPILYSAYDPPNPLQIDATNQESGVPMSVNPLFIKDKTKYDLLFE